MPDRLTSESLRFLLGVACVVIISGGSMVASHLLSVALLGLLVAYSLLPLPNWMMHQFKLRKNMALALTVGLMGTLQVVLIFLLYERAARMKEKLPIYQEHLNGLYEHISVFLHAHGIDITSFSVAKLSTSDQIFKFAQLILPQAERLFSDGFLVVLLGCIFLFRMAEPIEAKGKHVANTLNQIRGDVQRYIAISAMTGALTALANLVLLVAMGVDFPLVWCVLYFFLHFIPNIGFILALVPPACLALIMLGWKIALLVAGGLVLTQLVSDYLLTPLFMRKAVSISFMGIMLSLLGWGFLLGPAGAILAIPLTLALRRFIPHFSGEGELAETPSFAKAG